MQKFHPTTPYNKYNLSKCPSPETLCTTYMAPRPPPILLINEIGKAYHKRRGCTGCLHTLTPIIRYIRVWNNTELGPEACVFYSAAGNYSGYLGFKYALMHCIKIKHYWYFFPQTRGGGVFSKLLFTHHRVVCIFWCPEQLARITCEKIHFLFDRDKDTDKETRSDLVT